MENVWPVAFFISFLAHQSFAVVSLHDEVLSLRRAFQQQTDQTNKQMTALQKRVNDLEIDNYKKDQGN